jgi:hypothetical protein
MNKKQIYTVSIGERGATVLVDDIYNHPLTFGFNWPEFHVDEELYRQGKAIANLIAAAPELLEACKKAYDLIGVAETRSETLARAALAEVIAKVEGTKGG